MEINEKSENTMNNSASSFNNILLQKINHKPLIVSHIFSYMKNEPYKFINIIEKDKNLKDSMNSHFFQVNKNCNNLSHDLIQNLKTIKFCSNIKLKIIEYLERNEILYNKSFESYCYKNIRDPSFILYKSKYYLDRIKAENNSNIELIDDSFSVISDIIFNEQKIFQLTYLPYENDRYIDSNFLYKNKNKIEEINELYCIIDDNEYYKNNNFPEINKKIIINDIYFIYIKGNKKLNIFNAIKQYLQLLNKNTVKQITLGNNFFFIDYNNINYNEDEKYISCEKMPIMEMLNYAFINNRKLTNLIAENVVIKYEMINNDLLGDKLRIFFGLYFIFEKQKIHNFIILNNDMLLNYEDNKDYIENNKGDILILKFDDFSQIDFAKIKAYKEKAKISYILFYMNQKYIFSSNVEKTKNFIFNYYNNFDFYNFKNDLISSAKIYYFITQKISSDLLFLSDEYNYFSFKNYQNSRDIFNIFVLTTKTALVTKGIFKHKDISDIKSYIKEYFHENNRYPYEDTLTILLRAFPPKNKKDKNNRYKKKKKTFAKKINEKKLIENEIYEDNFYSEDYELEDYEINNE